MLFYCGALEVFSPCPCETTYIVVVVVMSFEEITVTFPAKAS